MKRSIRPTKKAVIIGIVEFAVITTLLAEVLAQASPDCPLPAPVKGGFDPGVITSGCSVNNSYTYESTPLVFRVNTDELVTINNVTIGPAIGNALLSTILRTGGSNDLNILNKGNLLSSRNGSVLDGGLNSKNSITNTGVMSIEIDPVTQLPTANSLIAIAIYIPNSNGLTLDNQTNGKIIGGSAGVDYLEPLADAKLSITNAGLIEAKADDSSAIKIKSNNTFGAGSFIQNDTAGTIRGKGNGIFISSNNSPVSPLSLSNLTITNRGSIVGTNFYGIELESTVSGATITNYGTISGGISAILFGNGGHTLNIHDGAVFTNGIDFKP